MEKEEPIGALGRKGVGEDLAGALRQLSAAMRSSEDVRVLQKYERVAASAGYPEVGRIDDIFRTWVTARLGERRWRRGLRVEASPAWGNRGGYSAWAICHLAPAEDFRQSEHLFLSLSRAVGAVPRECHRDSCTRAHNESNGTFPLAVGYMYQWEPLGGGHPCYLTVDVVIRGDDALARLGARVHPGENAELFGGEAGSLVRRPLAVVGGG